MREREGGRHDGFERILPRAPGRTVWRGCRCFAHPLGFNLHAPAPVDSPGGFRLVTLTIILNVGRVLKFWPDWDFLLTYLATVFTGFTWETYPGSD